MNAEQQPTKAHKGNRTKVLNIRATADEVAELARICQQRKKQGKANWSQADVLFGSLKTVDLGHVLYEFRQELCSMQSISERNKKLAKDNDERLMSRGQWDAITGMIHRLDTILSNYNQ